MRRPIIEDPKGVQFDLVQVGLADARLAVHLPRRGWQSEAFIARFEFLPALPGDLHVVARVIQVAVADLFAVSLLALLVFGSQQAGQPFEAGTAA